MQGGPPNQQPPPNRQPQQPRHPQQQEYGGQPQHQRQPQQHHQQQQHQGRRGTPLMAQVGAGRGFDPTKYKTKLCRSFSDNGTCRFGLSCVFAHGVEELRSQGTGRRPDGRGQGGNQSQRQGGGPGQATEGQQEGGRGPGAARRTCAKTAHALFRFSCTEWAEPGCCRQSAGAGRGDGAPRMNTNSPPNSRHVSSSLRLLKIWCLFATPTVGSITKTTGCVV